MGKGQQKPKKGEQPKKGAERGKKLLYLSGTLREPDQGKRNTEGKSYATRPQQTYLLLITG